MRRASIVVLSLCTFLVVIGLVGIFRTEVKASLFSEDEIGRYADGVFELSENLIVEGNATLFVENATISFVQSKSNQYGIILRNSANGNPKLVVRDSTFQSSKSINVSLWGNSSAELSRLRFAGSTSSVIELHDSSSLQAVNNCSLSNVDAHDLASLTVAGSRVIYLSLSDNSTAIVSASSVTTIKAVDNCSATVSLSSVEYSLNVDDSAFVSARSSSILGDVVARGDSSINMSEKISLTRPKFSLYDRSNVSLFNASVLMGGADFGCRNNSTLVLNDCLFSGASFKLYGNSIARVENSNLTSSLFQSFDSSLVDFLGSRQSWLLSCHDESRVLGSDSNFDILSADGLSNLLFSRCSIELVKGNLQSNISVSNTTIGEVRLELESVELNLSSFSEGYFDELAFQSGNFSFELSDTYVENGWSLNFLGSSNCSFYDAKLLNLDVFDSSRITLWNTSFVNLNMREGTEAYVWSFLAVSVKDYFGNAVESANVTVTLTGSFAGSMLTDNHGEATFALPTRTVNASGDFSNRDYRIGVYYNDYSSEFAVDPSVTGLVATSVPSPWWYPYLLWGTAVVAIIAVCIAALWILRRRMRPKKD